MTVTVKNKTPLAVPPSVRRLAGLKSGQKIEFKVSGGVISIYPKLPTADDEYTPEQRRIVDAQLAEGLAEIARRDEASPHSPLRTELRQGISTGSARLRRVVFAAAPAISRRIAGGCSFRYAANPFAAGSPAAEIAHSKTSFSGFVSLHARTETLAARIAVRRPNYQNSRIVSCR
jgi:bifunctional DNA-binding transcriptional regulator/antitoxin component of YhaV-PrlF toxin-antitoxin module